MKAISIIFALAMVTTLAEAEAEHCGCRAYIRSASGDLHPFTFSIAPGIPSQAKRSQCNSQIKQRILEMKGSMDPVYTVNVAVAAGPVELCRDTRERLQEVLRQQARDLADARFGSSHYWEPSLDSIGRLPYNPLGPVTPPTQ